MGCCPTAGCEYMFAFDMDNRKYALVVKSVSTVTQLRLQPSSHTVAALIACGCSPHRVRLQAGVPALREELLPGLLHRA
jgi:hypothetical protein